MAKYIASMVGIISAAAFSKRPATAGATTEFSMPAASSGLTISNLPKTLCPFPWANWAIAVCLLCSCAPITFACPEFFRVHRHGFNFLADLWQSLIETSKLKGGAKKIRLGEHAVVRFRVFILLLALCGAIYLALHREKIDRALESPKQYRCAIVIAEGRVEPSAGGSRMVIPIPPSLETQPRVSLEIQPPDAPVRKIGDQEYVIFETAKLQRGPVSVTIRTKHAPRLSARDYKSDPLRTPRYLMNDPKYNFDAPILKSALEEIKRTYKFNRKKTALEAIADIFVWTKSRMALNNDGDWRSADEAFRQRTGSCTEFAWIVSGFLRSLGVPTRLVAKKDHRWLQAFVPGEGWFDFESPSKGLPLRNYVLVLHTQSVSHPLTYDEWDYRPLMYAGGRWRTSGWSSKKGSFSAVQKVDICPP